MNALNGVTFYDNKTDDKTQCVLLQPDIFISALGRVNLEARFQVLFLFVVAIFLNIFA